MSDDLGDFLKEAARRRKERRERQETPRPRQESRWEAPTERASDEGVTEPRRTFAEQAATPGQTLGEVEAARYAARERHVERVGFAERAEAEARALEAKARRTARPSPSATPSPVPGAFSQPQALVPPIDAPVEGDVEALLRTLRSPGGMRQAFLLSEILRPKHLDF